MYFFKRRKEQKMMMLVRENFIYQRKIFDFFFVRENEQIKMILMDDTSAFDFFSFLPFIFYVPWT